jgi:hypothetical protein
MKLPNWFRVVYWVLFTGGLSTFLWLRVSDLLAGRATLFDIVAFLVWVGLLLAPLFGEIELWGLKLTQEIASVKEHVDVQVQSLRADIRNSVEVRSQFNPQITLMAPPTDAQLPMIEKQIKAAVETVLKSSHIEQKAELPPPVPEDNLLFFQARYSIERELRRIWSAHFPPDPQNPPLPPLLLILTLAEAPYLTQDLANAIREVYRVCSPALHGQQVTEAQRRFVQDVTPDLLRALRAIK